MKEIKDDILHDVEIYGFSGKLGSGKNYVAENVFMKMLTPKPTVVLCFADQIKIDGIYKHLLDRNRCWLKKDAYTREILQKIGTEEGRDVFGKDVWISNLKEWMIMHAFRGVKRFIIPDVRFKNEFNFIKKYGGIIIRVNAKNRNIKAIEDEAGYTALNEPDFEKREAIAKHSSETELDYGVKFDYILNNDFKQEHEVINQCKEVVKSINEKNKKNIVIFCDLDNTICECNENYMKQVAKVKSIINQNLEEPIPDKVFNSMFDNFVHKHNGEYYNYFFEIESFPQSLVMVLNDFKPFFNELSEEEFSAIENEVYNIGLQVFNMEYKELPDRIKGLDMLKEIGHIVLYTMGDRLEQVKKISHLGLSKNDFEIYDFKDETIYRNLKKRYPANKHVMIGDSYERDIKPAMKVGMETFLVKSKEGYWYPKEEVGKGFNHVENLIDVYNELKKTI